MNVESIPKFTSPAATNDGPAFLTATGSNRHFKIPPFADLHSLCSRC